jgi:hypothetical protein
MDELKRVAHSTRLNAGTLRRLADEGQPVPDRLREIADALDEYADVLEEQADRSVQG